MNRDDIIQMAREAQSVHATETWTFALSANQLERFATLVAQYEREQCAVAAEKQARWIGYNAHAEAIAAVIRERGEK